MMLKPTDMILPVDCRENLLLALSDSSCRKILVSITRKSKTVDEISQDIQHSKSTIYRKIHRLQKYNLIKTSGIFTKNGCKVFKYESRITKNKFLVFDEGFAVHVVLK